MWQNDDTTIVKEGLIRNASVRMPNKLTEERELKVT